MPDLRWLDKSQMRAVADELCGGLTVRALTLPDRFQDHDDMARQYEEAGLDAHGIATEIAKQFPAKTVIRA